MSEVPIWRKMSDDKDVEEAFVNADQATGNGVGDLIKTMIKNMEGNTGVTGFEWQREQSDPPQPKTEEVKK
jgi:hypothetical protein